MYISEVYNTSAIAAYMTEAYSNRIPFLGEAYFPNKKKMGLDLKWIKTHKGLGVALKPSNFDAIPTIRPRGEAQTTKEEMMFFRESMLIKEHDLMELSRIKDSNDPYLQPVIDSMYDDTRTLVEGAEISAERMRMNLLAPTSGEMEIIIPMADNTKATYDYDPDGTWKVTNYLALTGNDTWDNSTTAKPLNDIDKAIEYLASIGVVATTILGNTTTFNYLLENSQVKNALVSITGKAIDFIDRSTVKEVISRKLGLEWISYDKMYQDYDDSQKKFYPDNYVTILGNGQLGNTWRGTTPEELTAISDIVKAPQAPVDITVLDSGIAVAVQTVYKPGVAIETTASQIALPSFEGMDSIFVIKVK